VGQSLSVTTHLFSAESIPHRPILADSLLAGNDALAHFTNKRPHVRQY
jgi:hypothetical protein